MDIAKHVPVGFAHFWFFPSSKEFTNLPSPLGVSGQQHPCASCREKERLGKSCLCPRLLQSSLRVSAHRRAWQAFCWGRSEEGKMCPVLAQ